MGRTLALPRLLGGGERKKERKTGVPEDQQDYHRNGQGDQRGSVSDGVDQSHCGEV